MLTKGTTTKNVPSPPYSAQMLVGVMCADEGHYDKAMMIAGNTQVG